VEDNDKDDDKIPDKLTGVLFDDMTLLPEAGAIEPDAIAFQAVLGVEGVLGVWP
jgi:hypothetical protein